MMSTNFCTLTKKWFVLRSRWFDCKKKTMPCSVQQPMEDFILQQSPSPHVQELCWRIQSKTPWCLPPQTASRPKTLPTKKNLQSQVAMPCPNINHMRHASISHHVPRDDHVGRIHLFLLASRKGEVPTVPSSVGTTSLCPLFPTSRDTTRQWGTAMAMRSAE